MWSWKRVCRSLDPIVLLLYIMVRETNETANNYYVVSRITFGSWIETVEIEQDQLQ